MIIQVLSDLHCEFHEDGGRDFIAQIFDNRVDVLVLAGDVGNSFVVANTIKQICCTYKYTLVLFVPGNHDFYGSSMKNMLSVFSRLEDDLPNFRCLYNSSVTVSDRIFIGATLWFPRTHYVDENYKRLNDFRRIDNFSNEVFAHNDYSIKYLTSARIAKACVITHHLPTRRSISPSYIDDPFSAFFVCPLDKLIVGKQPYYWIHGHVHSSFDYVYYETRMICNPFGYLNKEENSKFNKKLLLEF